MSYDAFLSYSYAVDRPLAAAVQQGLHTLARHWYQVRALRVFRDQTSLTTSPGLWPSIEAALDDSAHFVLMASPEAAESLWVRREVEHWQQTRSQETFFIALTSGEIVWDDDAGDFDWAKTTALPPSLRGWFTTEPQWANLGWTREEAQISLRNARFRDEIGTLAAAVHGMSKYDFDNADVRRHRKSVWLRRAAVSGLAAIAVALGLIAWTASATAAHQRDQAIARGLAARAEALGDRDPARSRLLALAAWQIADLPETRAGMLLAAGRSGLPGFAVPAVRAVAVSADGRLIATAGVRGVRLWDAATGTPVGEPFGETGEVTGLALSRDGHRLAVAVKDKPTTVYRVTTGQTMFTVEDSLALSLMTHRSVAFSPEDATLAVSEHTGLIRLVDARTGLARITIAVHDEPQLPVVAPAFAYSPDGSTITSVSAFDGRLRRWNATTGAAVGAAVAAHPVAAIGLVAPSIVYHPGGKLIAVAATNGTVSLWDAATARAVGSVPVPGERAPAEGTTPSVAFSRDGGLVAAGSPDGGIGVWQTDTLRPVGAPLRGHTSAITALAFGPDALLVSAGGGEVRRWTLGDRLGLISPLPGDTGPLYSVTWSPNGRTIAASGHGPAGLTGQGRTDSCLTGGGWSVCLTLPGRQFA